MSAGELRDAYAGDTEPEDFLNSDRDAIAEMLMRDKGLDVVR